MEPVNTYKTVVNSYKLILTVFNGNKLSFFFQFVVEELKYIYCSFFSSLCSLRAHSIDSIPE